MFKSITSWEEVNKKITSFADKKKKMMLSRLYEIKSTIMSQFEKFRQKQLDLEVDIDRVNSKIMITYNNEIQNRESSKIITIKSPRKLNKDVLMKNIARKTIANIARQPQTDFKVNPLKSLQTKVLNKNIQEVFTSPVSPIKRISNFNLSGHASAQVSPLTKLGMKGKLIKYSKFDSLELAKFAMSSSVDRVEHKNNKSSILAKHERNDTNDRNDRNRIIKNDYLRNKFEYKQRVVSKFNDSTYSQNENVIPSSSLDFATLNNTIVKNNLILDSNFKTEYNENNYNYHNDTHDNNFKLPNVFSSGNFTPQSNKSKKTNKSIMIPLSQGRDKNKNIESFLLSSNTMKINISTANMNIKPEEENYKIFEKLKEKKFGEKESMNNTSTSFIRLKMLEDNNNVSNFLNRKHNNMLNTLMHFKKCK